MANDANGGRDQTEVLRRTADADGVCWLLGYRVRSDDRVTAPSWFALVVVLRVHSLPSRSLVTTTTTRWSFCCCLKEFSHGRFYRVIPILPNEALEGFVDI